MRFFMILGVVCCLLMNSTLVVATPRYPAPTPEWFQNKDSPDYCDSVAIMPNPVIPRLEPLPSYRTTACNENTTLEAQCWWIDPDHAAAEPIGNIACEIILRLNDGSLWVEASNFSIWTDKQVVIGQHGGGYHPDPWARNGVMVREGDDNRCSVDIYFFEVESIGGLFGLQYFDSSIGQPMAVVIPDGMTTIPYYDRLSPQVRTCPRSPIRSLQHQT